MSDSNLASSRYLNEWILFYPVYSQSLRLENVVAMTSIYEHEKDLDAGRFKDFVRPEQPFHIYLEGDLFKCNSPPLSMLTAQWINWIAEHNTAPWSLTAYVEDILIAKFTFSFSDITMAATFKLVFS